MAVISFKLYDDSGLTTLSNTTLAVSVESDLSDGSHDFQYYFGSNEVSKQLQTQVSPGVNNITLTPTYILPSRANSTAYVLGDSVVPSPVNGYRYVCTTAGTSGASAPTWGTTLNGTTTDGTAVWTLVAEDSPISEVKLALTQAGLDTATGGASLALTNVILSGAVNAVTFWVRVTNTITQVSNSIGTPELGLVINAVKETSTT